MFLIIRKIYLLLYRTHVIYKTIIMKKIKLLLVAGDVLC